MVRKLSGWLVLLACSACIGPKIRQAPPGGTYFQAMNIKFNFSDRQGKQNGRVYWRFDGRHAKFLFFTPLNQVALELDVAGETAWLLRPGKKLFWRGDFSHLLNHLWGIELTLEKLKGLLLCGEIPEGKLIENGMKIDLQTDAGDPAPRIVNIRQNDATLILKITNRETRVGDIVLLDYERRFQAAALEEILNDD